jgi:hypothetical protein
MILLELQSDIKFSKSYLQVVIKMFSIYVPRVLNEHTVQTVTDIMAHFRVGIVHYVDFTPINKKPGFYETFDGKYKSAFIHFIEVPGYQKNVQFWNQITDTETDNDTSLSNGMKMMVRLQISPYEYWICLKNNSPVKRTLMNIHQVVENSRYLEDRIQTLEDRIQTLEDRNKTLEDRNKTLEDTQNLILNKLDILLQVKDKDKDKDKKTEWNILDKYDLTFSEII